MHHRKQAEKGAKRRDKLQEAAYLKNPETAYLVSNEKFDEKIEEMAEVSDEFAAQNAAEEAERVEASRSRSKIERSMQRYAACSMISMPLTLVRRSAKNFAHK